MDLSTQYLGLELRNPLVASASPLPNTVDGVRRLADAGAGRDRAAVAVRGGTAARGGAGRGAGRRRDGQLRRVAVLLPGRGRGRSRGPRRYLSLVERAVAAVDVPVIASLNGVTTGGWTDYATALEQAGAAAIELNIYHLPGDPLFPGRDVEQRHVEILTTVKAVVSVPVAVKLSPYYSSTGEMALRLDRAGRRRPGAVQPVPAARTSTRTR